MADPPNPDNENKEVDPIDRIRMLWRLLTGKYVAEHGHLLYSKEKGATALESKLVGTLRLELSDMDVLIERRPLSWKYISAYIDGGKRGPKRSLIMGSVLILKLDLDSEACPYPYIVSFDEYALCSIQGPDKADDNELKVTLQYLFDKFVSTLPCRPSDVSLVRPTPYSKILSELNICLDSAAISREEDLNDPELNRWIVQNVKKVTVYPSKVSDETWTVLQEALTGESSKVVELFVAMKKSDPSHHTRLIDIVRQSNIKRFGIEVYSSDGLQPYLDAVLGNAGIKHIHVGGECLKVEWLACLLNLLRCKRFLTVYFVTKLVDCNDNEFADWELEYEREFLDEYFILTKAEEKSIIDGIRQYGSMYRLLVNDTAKMMNDRFWAKRVNPILEKRYAAFLAQGRKRKAEQE